IVPAAHSRLLPVEVPHRPEPPGLAYGTTSPTTRTSVWIPSTLAGMLPTPGFRVRTSTASRPFGPTPVPVPTTSGIFISSGVWAFCTRIARATSFGLCAESADATLDPPELVGELIDPSRLQLVRTSAAAATRRSETTSRRRALCFLGMEGPS